MAGGAEVAALREQTAGQDECIAQDQVQDQDPEKAQSPI